MVWKLWGILVESKGPGIQIWQIYLEWLANGGRRVFFFFFDKGRGRGSIMTIEGNLGKDIREKEREDKRRERKKGKGKGEKKRLGKGEKGIEKDRARGKSKKERKKRGH